MGWETKPGFCTNTNKHVSQHPSSHAHPLNTAPDSVSCQYPVSYSLSVGTVGYNLQTSGTDHQWNTWPIVLQDEKWWLRISLVHVKEQNFSHVNSEISPIQFFTRALWTAIWTISALRVFFTKANFSMDVFGNDYIFHGQLFSNGPFRPPVLVSSGHV